ncbi:hypothetical protein BH10BAC2_BH10BAC2_18130 [soil metagenome]
MKYPLEGLQLLIKHNLHPQRIETFICNSNASHFLTEEIIIQAGQARIDICRYISTVKNTTQAAYRIHAMNVVLHDLTLTLSGYENTLFSCLPGNLSSGNISELYSLAKEQVIKIRIFICDNFDHENDKRLAVCFPGNASVSEKNQQPVETNLSVPQLAVFVRLLVDTGIIAGRINIASLTTNIAVMLRTRKASQISAESLRIKYYTPEQPAINILKEYLLQMMEALKKYK